MDGHHAAAAAVMLLLHFPPYLTHFKQEHHGHMASAMHDGCYAFLMA